MKVYKQDIDVSKPTRQVKKMQQNTTGVLSVNVTNDGWIIHNLSCQLFDGENEISACVQGDYGAAFKIEVGDTDKAVMVKAKATPIESVASYFASSGSGSATKSFALSCVQLEAGTYRQDEFYNVMTKFASSAGMIVDLRVNYTDLSNANFGVMRITHSPNTNESKLYFFTGDGNSTLGDLLPEDAPIIATGPVHIYNSVVAKRNASLSSYTYPAVGYYADYQLETVINASTMAPCYAERDAAELEPTPEPEPETEPTPESEET